MNATIEGIQVHELKCWPDAFFAIREGDKNAEFRRDDRGFKRGDLILLREYIPSEEEWQANGGDLEIWRDGFWVDPVPADGGEWDGEDHGDDYWAYVTNRDLPEYSGETLLARIKHVQTGFGIPDGYCVLSIVRVKLT